MPTRCKCGRTRCLECVGECPDCNDVIENYIGKEEVLTCSVKQ